MMNLLRQIATSRKLKLFLANVLMLLISTAIGFVILEYGLARYYYSDISQKRYKEFDSELGWINKPGNYLIKPTQSLIKNSIYINKYGLRNRDIKPENDDAVKRIIILGDSFTFASAISSNDIFPTQIEGILNSSLPNKYEVINAGVEGYGNVQELLLMKKLADNQITGDIYVLMIFINDILDNLSLSYGNAAENLIQPRYELDANNNLVLKRAPQKTINDSSNLIAVQDKKRTIILFDTLKVQLQTFLQTNPYLISLLNKMGIETKFPRVPGLINGWYDEDVLNKGIPVLRKSIEEISIEAEKRSARLFISVIPSPLQVYPDTYGPLLEKTFPDNEMVNMWLKDKLVPQQIVKGICDELHIPFLDLYPILYKNNNRQLYIPNEGHLTKEGHAIVAVSLANFLSADQQLPK